MHAVFVVSELDPNRIDQADQLLKDRMAPEIKGAPGFISGTWARSDGGTEGRSLLLFDSERAARAVIDRIRSAMPAESPVKVMTASVLEVVHQV